MSDPNKLETWGNETNMNMNPIIYQNILASPYFKSLYDKKTYHEIVDEIYNEVYTLEPFMKGTAASTAFCLLFKLWTQRLTVKQIEGVIDHTDSPYIRGIGFLYLRYVCAPKQLWDWLGPYIDDDEEIDISGGPKPVKSTIGKLCRHLLTDIKYYGTMLPRIPVPIAREIEKKMADYDRERKGGSKGGRAAEDRRSNADGGRGGGREDYKRRDDSRGSRNDRRRSRSRSPYRRERSRHDSRDRSRHDSRDKSRQESRDRYRQRRDRSPSPHDEFDEYEKRSRRDDERRRHSRETYRDRSRDRGRDRSYDRSYRRRSRSGDRRR